MLMAIKLKKLIEWIAILVVVILLENCASPEAHSQITLKKGVSWQQVVKVSGKPTVNFSYVVDGKKYDLVSFEESPNPIVFENTRLFKVLPPDAATEFDRKIAEHVKTVDLPFENGVGAIHAWILDKNHEFSKPAKQDPITAGDIAEAATTGVILAPIAPILLAGGVCSVAQNAMTGGERTRAQQVNESLLSSGPTYETFLKQFDHFDFHTANRTYQIREYLATDGAFFTGRDFFYEVGFRNDKPFWVAYKNDAVRFHAVRYWRAHR